MYKKIDKCTNLINKRLCINCEYCVYCTQYLEKHQCKRNRRKTRVTGKIIFDLYSCFEERNCPTILAPFCNMCGKNGRFFKQKLKN